MRNNDLGRRNRRASRVFIGALLAMTALFGALPATAVKAATAGYPKLFAMATGNNIYLDKDYLDRLAKMNAVVLSGPRNENIDDVLSALHARNPSQFIGFYTLVNEAYDDGLKWHAPELKQKLDAENWWLRDSGGNMVQWTNKFKAWDVNITDWTKPDAQGLRYPEWLNRRNDAIYFKSHPGVGIWYFDNAFGQPRDREADWRMDGEDLSNTSPEVQAAYRAAQAKQWRDARALEPGLLEIGNVPDGLAYPEYAGQLNGAFLEALVGISWSIEARQGWQAAMDRYRETLRDTRPPHLVDFDVRGAADDYRLMRYGLASALMDNGYFSYSDKDKLYGSPPMFDEYGVSLGAAIDPPQMQPWQNGVYRRRFQYGMALVNPSPFLPATVEVGSGYVHIDGHQDPSVNNGQPANEILIPPKDGVILLTASNRQSGRKHRPRGRWRLP